MAGGGGGCNSPGCREKVSGVLRLIPRLPSPEGVSSPPSAVLAELEPPAVVAEALAVLADPWVTPLRRDRAVGEGRDSWADTHVTSASGCLGPNAYTRICEAWSKPD